MLVEVLKENYVVVLSESSRDERWLDQAGYQKLGEDYFQELFKDLNAMVLEVELLLSYGAQFEDRFDDEDAPFKVLSDLKDEGLIK